MAVFNVGNKANDAYIADLYASQTPLQGAIREALPRSGEVVVGYAIDFTVMTVALRVAHGTKAGSMRTLSFMRPEPTMPWQLAYKGQSTRDTVGMPAYGALQLRDDLPEYETEPHPSPDIRTRRVQRRPTWSFRQDEAPPAVSVIPGRFLPDGRVTE